MFGLFDDAIDLVTSPLRDTREVLEGLTEGELRLRAAARLGSSVVSGMETAELIDLLLDVNIWSLSSVG